MALDSQGEKGHCRIKYSYKEVANTRAIHGWEGRAVVLAKRTDKAGTMNHFLAALERDSKGNLVCWDSAAGDTTTIGTNSLLSAPLAGRGSTPKGSLQVQER